MHAPAPLKALMCCAGLAALAGCLVSETPILDTSNGRARPLAPGDYVMCPVDEETDGDDCERFSLERDDTGLYRLVNADEDEDEMLMRLRRVGRGGYAAQMDEHDEDDDGYAYYYGHGNSDAFRLTMMMCDQLPADLREELIAGGDLSTEEDDFSFCTVETLKGLTAAARAYHRGEAGDEDAYEIEFRPASAAPAQSQ